MSLVVSLMDTIREPNLSSSKVVWSFYEQKRGFKSFPTWETSALKYKHPSGLQISQQIPIMLQSNPSPPTWYIMKIFTINLGQPTHPPTHPPSLPPSPTHHQKVGYPLGHHHLSSPKGLLKHHAFFFSHDIFVTSWWYFHVQNCQENERLRILQVDWEVVEHGSQ